MSAQSERLLNECSTCGHTRYPRTDRISSRCPSCGCKTVGLAQEKRGNQSDEESRKALRALTAYVVARLGEGTSVENIREELVKEGGIGRDAAEKFVAAVHTQLMEEVRRSPEGRKVLRDKYARHMLYGILWIAGGGLVTLLTYSMAKGGGIYFIFWGAMLWGAIDFIWGLVGWLENKD